MYFDGVLQTKGAGADYVMGGDGTTSTGYITTNVAQADTVTVAITLDIPLDQPVVLQETGSLPAKTIEVEGFDRLNMQIRRVWRSITNGLRFSDDEGGAGSTGTADNLLGFNGSGDIAEIPNTTFAQTANNLSDVDAATARANLGVDAAGTDNSTDVTKTGAGTYVSLAGQVLTVDEITETDLNTSTNASLDKADSALQSGVAAASDIVDFDTEVANNTTVAANTNDRHVAATKSGTGTYVSLTGQDIVVDPIQDGDVDSEASTSDKVLKSDGASGAVWGNVEGTEVKSTGEAAGDSFLRENGDGTCSWISLANLGVGNALVENPLSQFATTTAAQLAGVITAGQTEGTGDLVFATSPTLVTPDLGTPSAINLTNAISTALPAAAANKILGTVTAGTVEEISCTSAGRDLLDDADASAQRTTLGLAIGTDVAAWDGVGDSVTGTATFTNSSNTIALTGVGLLEGLAVGDVIEVTGSTTGNNDKAFTVYSITDNSIVVNDAHAGKTWTAKNKTLEEQSSVSGVTVTLACKANNAPLGYGQSWVEVTRGTSVTYPNSTGRTIGFVTRGITGSNFGYIQMLVDGDILQNSQDGSTSVTLDGQCIVPNGSDYSFVQSNVTMNFKKELR